MVLYYAAAVFFSEVLGSISGFGVATVLLPLALLYYPLSEVLLIVSIIHFSGGLFRLFLVRAAFEKKVIFAFGLPAIAGSALAALTVTKVTPDIAVRVIGVFILAYVLFIIVNPRFSLKKSILNLTSTGLLSGGAAGFFGVGGGLRMAALSAFGLKKEVYIATGAFVGAMIDVGRITAYVIGGFKLPAAFGASTLALLILPALLGVLVGVKILKKIPETKFRYVLAVFLLALSLYLIFRF